MRRQLSPWAAFLVGGAIFGILVAICEATTRSLPPLGANAVLKAALLAVSLLLMLASGCGWRAYGFRRPQTDPPRKLRWRRVVASGALLGALATIAILASPAQGMNLMESATLPQLVLAIWIWSTVTEEIFVRGWVQSSVRDDGDGFLGNGLFTGRLSAPVLTGALLFGAMHLSLFLRGTDGWTVTIIVLATTLLGLMAGLYRETSGSLVPAIVCHGAFNVVGFVAGVLWMITTRSF